MDILLLLILTVIIVWVLLPIIRVWLGIRRVRRQARDFFDQSAGNFYGNGQRRNPQSPPSRPPRHKKIIDSDVGEYIEFEEISTYSSTSDGSTETAETTTRTTITADSQIEDADWEEIK